MQSCNYILSICLFYFKSIFKFKANLQDINHFHLFLFSNSSLILYVAQVLPTLVIILINWQKFIHCPFCRLHQIPWLKHKRIIILRYLVWLLLAFRERFIRFCIRPMRSHTRVQGGTSWSKIFSFCVINSWYVSHEFRHTISVVVWRLECVFSYQPSWRKYDKVQSGHSIVK